MTDIVDDTGMKLTEVSTLQLIYMRDLPRSDPKWEGCPYSIDDVKIAINSELEKRFTADNERIVN